MPVNQRIKTRFPGVYYIESVSKKTGSLNKVFYIRYRRDKKQHEEKIGSQELDNMTAEKAAAIRRKIISENKAPKNSKTHLLDEPHQGEVPTTWTIDRLWASYASKQKKHHSIASDISRYNKFIKTPFGNKELAEVVPADINRFRTNLLKTKSPQTVKHVLGLINRLHYYSIKNNLAPGLSFVIKMPEVKNNSTEILAPEQLTALLQAIEASEHKTAGAMMKIALFTGMRRSVMFRLKWEDIDLKKKTINISKPGSKPQTIPMNESARKVLTELPQTSKYVFPDSGGKQPYTVTREVNAIKKGAGLPEEFRPLEGLRHTYASMLAASGKVDMETLQKLLTHKTPQMTQRYAPLRDKALREAADIAGDIFSGVIKKNKEKQPGKIKQQSLPLDINQYDIAKKIVKKAKQKKIDKGEKKTITRMKQLKIPGLG